MNQELTMESDGGVHAVNIGGAILLVLGTLFSVIYLWVTTHGQYGRVGFQNSTISEFISQTMIPTALVKPFDDFSYSTSVTNDAAAGGKPEASMKTVKATAGVNIQGNIILQFANLADARAATSASVISAWNEKTGKPAGVSLSDCVDRAYFVVCRSDAAQRTPVDYYNVFMQW